MSWQCSKRVWDNATDISGNFKLTLLALAEIADERGICWPSQDTLSDMVGVNRRSIIRILDEELVPKGYIYKQSNRGRHQVNKYLVTCGLLKEQVADILVREFDLSKKEANEYANKCVTGNTLNRKENVLPDDKNVLPDSKKCVTGNTPTIMNHHEPPINKDREKQQKRPASVHVFQQVVHRFPHKSLWPKMDTMIGDGVDNLERWRQVLEAWLGQGWNPLNVNGQLDCFSRGEIPGQKGKTNGTYKGNCSKGSGQTGTRPGVSTDTYFDIATGQHLPIGAG